MLHYSIIEHATSKEWVTFVHGAGGSSTIWYKQVKAFKEHFNILLLDLRGHGKSKFHLKEALKSKYTFDAITQDIKEVVDYLEIKKSHFVGISLGTILIRNLAEKHPTLVKSMVMGGAIMKMNFRSRVLMRLGVILKSVVPYIWLYKFFAFVIMPNKNHKESRSLFVREAKKLYQKEFIRWFKLTSEINPLLKLFRMVDLKIPTLYVMGSEDYLFLPTIEKVAEQHTFSQLYVVPDCGHVVNVEQPHLFNEKVIAYLRLDNKKTGALHRF
ncbi:alpha/beta fold hydrolase [Croceivirga sp. JEA036]|uniref:alpha/beta fold hydrolase n=1 Tax=Croceivirga sp. JEA036 TaxID=2721162 RepID=UPI00143B946F|nr:alpha/beta hydrolase [Croceivirga sp. JEA036]NJB37449.1 alpha/beta hydrolase [Croceivirga sp. JEA036]